MREPYRVPTRNVIIAASGSMLFIVFSVLAVWALAIPELPATERAAGWAWFAGAWLVSMVVALILQVPLLRRGTAFPHSAEEQARTRERNMAAMRPFQGAGVTAGVILSLFMAPSFWAVVCGVVAGLFTYVLAMTLLAPFVTSRRAPQAGRPGPE